MVVLLGDASAVSLTASSVDMMVIDETVRHCQISGFILTVRDFHRPTPPLLSSHHTQQDDIEDPLNNAEASKSPKSSGFASLMQSEYVAACGLKVLSSFYIYLII